MADHQAGTGRRAGFLQGIALLLPITMAVMGSVVLQPVQGLLTDHFSGVPGNEYWVPFLLTVPAIAATAFSVVSGFLADWLGRRRILLLAMALYLVVGVGPFFLQSLLPIAICRILVGICEGVVLTVTTALIGDYFEGSTRDRLMGMQAAVATISASVLIPLSGYLGHVIGWNGPFLIYGISLLWLIGVWLFTWEPRPTIERPAVPERYWHGFPWRQMLPLCAVTFVGGYYFYTVQFEVPTLLPKLGIDDPAKIGALMGLVSWGMAVGAIGFQALVRLRLSLLLFIELAIIAGSFLVIGRAHSSTTVVAASFVNQIGCGSLLPTLLAASTRSLPFAHRGRGTGFWQGTWASSQFVVGMSFPALSAGFGGDRAQALFAIGLTAAGCVILAVAYAVRDQLSVRKRGLPATWTRDPA